MLNKKLSLQLRIYIPVALLIILSHGIISFHISRVLETDKIFESIIVSILQRNIVGSAIIVLMIAFGLISYLVHGIQKDSNQLVEEMDLLKNLDLESLPFDEEIEAILNFDEAEALDSVPTYEPKLDVQLTKDLVHPLAAILGHAQLAKMKGPNQDILKNLEFIEEEARKVKKIIEDHVEGQVPALSQAAELENLFNRENKKEDAQRPRRHTRIKLSQALLENFTKFPELPEPADIPAFAAFPQESLLTIAAEPVTSPEASPEVSTVTPKRLTSSKSTGAKLSIRRPVTRVQQNET